MQKELKPRANILRSEDMMWKFVRSPETTNNLAERQARRYVIYRKNSFFTWSGRGEKFIERMCFDIFDCTFE